MEVAIGILVGVIFGLLSAFGATLYVVVRSNAVGEDKGKAGHFMYDSEVFFHEKRNK